MELLESMASGTVHGVSGQANAVAIRNRFQFPSSFQLRPSLENLNAARSIVFRVLFLASQAFSISFQASEL